MRTFTLDIETDAIDNPSVVWCAVAQDVDTEQVYKFVGDYTDLPDLVSGHTIVGHNFIGYDYPVLERLIGFNHPKEDIIDTLILSRLYMYKQKGGHSLDSWGKRFRFPKGDFKNFSKYSDEMLDYCIQDVKLTTKLYHYLKERVIEREEFNQAIETEHGIAWLCNKMSDNGFPFDVKEAGTLYNQLDKEVAKLDQEIFAEFKPKPVPVRQVTPRETKAGTLHLGDFRWMKEKTPNLDPFAPGCSFTIIDWQPFNPRSPKQIIDRLEPFGWNPVDKTKGHKELQRELQDYGRKHLHPPKELTEKLTYYEKYGWKCNENNLSTLSPEAPEAAHRLVRRLMLSSRMSTLQSWVKAYRPEDTQTHGPCITPGRVHGRFTGIGAWTHRMSHSEPNMGNPPSSDSEYGPEMRRLWTATPSTILVGADASGIQLRILAHYLNNPEFTKAVVEGNEEDGTDIHSINQQAIGHVCKTRKIAKRFIYSWLLGAGEAETANILDCTIGQSRTARQDFMDRWDGLTDLRQQTIANDAERGYFKGLDGRLVACSSTHLMLSGYLQNGEAIVMKMATLLWYKQLLRQNIPFWIVNFVHDEWQTLTLPAYAEQVGQIQVKSLKTVGEKLNLNCPIDGEYKIGDNWAETH